MQEIKTIELFSGIGSQSKGINNTGLFKTVNCGTSDLDKEVIVSYAAIHCGLTKELIENYDYPPKEQMINDLTKKRIGFDFKKNKSFDWTKLSKRTNKLKGIEKYWFADKLSKNLGDVSQILSLPNCDLLTYSFPCTDISLSGIRENGTVIGTRWTCKDCNHIYNPKDINIDKRYSCPACGSKNVISSRSGLLYEVERLLDTGKKNKNLPKFLLMENVDSLLSSKMISNFNDWINRLDLLGYNSYYKILNSKYFGNIPQNRNRIFVLSIRKDIDTGKFEFAKEKLSSVKFENILEDEAEENFFLTEDKVEKLLQTFDVNDLIKNNPIKQIPIYVKNNGTLFVHKSDFAHTLLARDYKGLNNYGSNVILVVDKDKIKARRVTPLECHRLMGFSDIDWQNCVNVGVSNSQGIKQAGNSIVTSCISMIAKQLYYAQYEEKINFRW